jgi:hypothetical protein
MAPPSITIEALAQRQRSNALADTALALSATLFVGVCVLLADHSAVQRLAAPPAPSVPDPPAGVQFAALPRSDLGTPVIEVSRTGPAPRPANDLQRRIAAIRQGMENAVSGREVDGLAYVSLPTVAGMVDGECRWDPAARQAIAISGEGLARFTQDASTAEFNGEAVGLPGPARRFEADLYLPAKSLVALYGATIDRDEDSGVLRVDVHGKRFPIVSEQAFRMEISRSERWLRVFFAGKPAKEYPICSGAGENTPVGHFHIENKAEWPSWRAYWGEYMAGGSPRNPLGARWLGTTARGRVTGWPIGIHGTNDPSSIGQRLSGGCVRTYNHNAIELYDTIPIGTPLWIHE